MPKQRMFTWRAQPVKTIEDLTDALHGVVRRNSPSEAALFLERYREVVGDNAEVNVGYCLGYLSKENMLKGLRLFDVNHPILGSANDARKLSSEQVFALGLDLGRQSAIEGRVAF